MYDCDSSFSNDLITEANEKEEPIGAYGRQYMPYQNEFFKILQDCGPQMNILPRPICCLVTSLSVLFTNLYIVFFLAFKLTEIVTSLSLHLVPSG